MTVNLTIVGLGKIGASIGLALSRHTDSVFRLGHDKDPAFARRAQRMGAIDKVAHNLPASVREANLILLALPVDQIRETLESIVADLREGAVVMDTSPVNNAVASWATELLPARRHYVGLTPVLNSAYLHETSSGTETAQEDLFVNGLMGIAAPPRADSGAIKLAADLTTLLGAKPFFLDLVEADSLMAATHLVPQLVAASMVSATVNQPGWLEGGKLAGAAYAQVGSPTASIDTSKALGNAALLSQEHVVRVLDNVLASLSAFREAIASQDEEDLLERLKNARKGHEQWWQQREKGEWEAERPSKVEMPTSAGGISQLFFGRRRKVN